MSHATGTHVTLPGPQGIGPAFGAPDHLDFVPAPAPPPVTPPGGIKLLILHFSNASFPGNSRLEVALGYGTDVFTSADGAEFWTRPINASLFPGGVSITYFPDGGGGVQLISYGRGERHEEEDPGGAHDSYSNCDPFLKDGNYTEPQYDPFWFCGVTPQWENVAALPDSIQKQVAASACMLVAVHGDHVSTCSATLVGPDLVITAGHCVTDPDMEVPTMSVIFNYQTNADGSKPPGYNAIFHKVIRHVHHGTLGLGGSGPIDYLMIQIKIPAGGLGIPPIPMRNSLPAIGEQVFGIHHPNGAVKKVSRRHTDAPATVTSTAPTIGVNIDVSGGSSGSGLFDMMGRFLGVLSSGGSCSLGYAPSVSILDHIGSTPVPSPARDVMIVFDRSGSMSMDAGTGQTKIEEARDAASLFVQLIRTTGADRIGLVSFSTTATAPVEFTLHPVNNANKTTLIGPMPFSGGIVGNLMPGGNTSIGDGLAAARDTFTGGPNRKTIFLLTDGLQNTPPMIENVEGSLSNIDVVAVGFGTEAGLNGPLLTQLTQTHNGLYMRAGDGLDLKKFFSLAFGNIFEAGTLNDPVYFLPAEERAAKPIPFMVCEESSITVVLGWDKEAASLYMVLKAPSGKIILPSDASVESSRGKTWEFMRLHLPDGTDQSGKWEVLVTRPGGGGEFPPPGIDVRFFVNVIVKDGPFMAMRMKQRKFFTGDIVNPLVAIYKANGYPPANAAVKVTVTSPIQSVGNILAEKGLVLAGETGGDGIPPRYATLQQIEAAQQKPVIDYRTDSFDLFDDGSHGDGSMEPDGIFGNPLLNLLRHEGHYTFHAVATYGDNCQGTRELTWTVYADIGIDPGQTTVSTTVITTLPDGRQRVKVTFIPKDKYGNKVGPGRADAFTLNGLPGSEIEGTVTDKGDGSYEVVVDWHTDASYPPGVVISQDDRDPIIIAPKQDPKPDCSKWKRRNRLLWWLLLLALLLLLLCLIIHC